MRLIQLLFLLLTSGAVAGQSTPSWNWVSGDGNFSPTPPHYGTRGVASPANKPPHRDHACTWTDKGGNLWLFGGSEGLNVSFYNDLWKYDPATRAWTWMHGDTVIDRTGIYGVKGVPDPLNKPAARSNACSWIDSAGNLWLYGGYFNYGNNNFNQLSDLWKYNVQTNQWTWVGGSNGPGAPAVFGVKRVASATNWPGATERAMCWTGRDGRFWMYGGSRVVNQSLTEWNNQMWCYDPAVGLWTWVTGSKISNHLWPNALSQTEGQFSDVNTPGDLLDGATCVDSAGRLWLFGGAPVIGFSNELWCFDPGLQQWALLRGNMGPIPAGYSDWPAIYGQKNVPDSTNIPGSRKGAILWNASDDQLWLFGGYGVTARDHTGFVELNDLWRFDMITKKWTWVKGDSTGNSLGRYGLKGVADTLNNPPARESSANWVDPAGRFWLFGSGGYYTDMWMLDAGTIGKQTELQIWGQFDGADIVVDWKTTREVGTHHFILEKGVSRSALSPVDSVAAAGYSITSRTYQYRDTHPFADTNFYRVRVVHTSGVVLYSPVIALVKQGGMQVDPLSPQGLVYPNPVRSRIQVRITAAGPTTLTLYDITGRRLWSEQLLVNTPLTHPIDLSGFPAAPYLLVLEQAQARQCFKLVKY